jgi:hypothetical protein
MNLLIAPVQVRVHQALVVQVPEHMVQLKDQAADLPILATEVLEADLLIQETAVIGRQVQDLIIPAQATREAVQIVEAIVPADQVQDHQVVVIVPADRLVPDLQVHVRLTAVDQAQEAQVAQEVHRVQVVLAVLPAVQVAAEGKLVTLI